MMVVHKVLYNKAEIKSFTTSYLEFMCVDLSVEFLQKIGDLLKLGLDIYVKSHQEILPLKLPFFRLLTSPRLNAMSHESESTGSQPVYRKLSPYGLYSF